MHAPQHSQKSNGERCQSQPIAHKIWTAIAACRSFDAESRNSRPQMEPMRGAQVSARYGSVAVAGGMFVASRDSPSLLLAAAGTVEPGTCTSASSARCDSRPICRQPRRREERSLSRHLTSQLASSVAAAGSEESAVRTSFSSPSIVADLAALGD